MPPRAAPEPYLSYAINRLLSNGGQRTRRPQPLRSHHPQPKAEVALLIWTLVLASHVFAMAHLLRDAWRRRHLHGLACLLLFASALPVTLYGMLTNGESKEAETPVLIVSCGVLLASTFSRNDGFEYCSSPSSASVVAGNIFCGATRERLLGIGPGVFFEYHRANRSTQNVMYRNHKMTPYMENVLQKLAR